MDYNTLIPKNYTRVKNLYMGASYVKNNDADYTFDYIWNNWGDGYYTWYYKKKIHREDGPAKTYIITRPTTKIEETWWLYGIRLDSDIVKDWLKENNYLDAMLLHYNNWNDNIKLHFKLNFCE